MSDPAGRAEPGLNLKVVVERTFQARRERIFRAWTDAEWMGRWFAPAPVKPVDVEANPVVGGAFRVGMPQEDGSVHYAVGRYVEVLPPQRLVFTWAWQGEGPPPQGGDQPPQGGNQPIETLVTVEFFELGEATRVVLTHERLPTPSSQEDHRRGWGLCLENLELSLHNGDKDL
jgi:uncharacterized protein YndB with AHSA1/START domain